MSAPGTEVFGSSLSTSNVIQKRSNASLLMSQIHKVCGLARMVTVFRHAAIKGLTEDRTRSHVQMDKKLLA